MPARSTDRLRSVRIRRARDGDLAALVALENEAFVTDRISARQWRWHFRNPRADLLVATRHGTLVGAAAVFFRARHGVARLYSVAVTEALRGQGIGEVLLDAAERAARRRGSRALRLEARSDSAATKRFYEKRGYHPLGVKVGFYEDGCDAHRYEKLLASTRKPTGRA